MCAANHAGVDPKTTVRQLGQNGRKSGSGGDAATGGRVLQDDDGLSRHPV